MQGANWTQEKEDRREKSLETHARLSKLFLEDRLSFERERRKAIKDLIEGVQDEEVRCRLWEVQRAWDKRMKGAGSPHNRLVLAQAFFWEHFHKVWQPAIKELDLILNGK